MHEKLRVGIIGCGAISKAYFNGCKAFPSLEVVACADLDPARAQEKAAEYSIGSALPVEALLRDPDVDLVVNLTIPAAHAEVNRAALAAGKHIFCEKPFAVTRMEGRPVLELAHSKGLYVGSAPDTFLGDAHQTARQLIDDGAIGQPVAAVAFMACHGHESWHPNPAFYYQAGGGPMFDMGPYYLTDLVHLLGPMRRVSGSVKTTFAERLITSAPLHGTRIQVTTPTHLTGVIDFASGAAATVIMSFDTWGHNLPLLEIYGTEGTLSVPDPNSGTGIVRLRGAQDKEWRDMPSTHSTIAARGAGVADLALAIRERRPNRANGEMALHVVDAMQAFAESSQNGMHVTLSTTCRQPAPLVPGELEQH
jgi:predicted dehydrogenase